MESISQPFYVYILARPNGKPFYVGKGKGDRIYDHDREAKRGHKCYKCNVIRKIWHNGGDVQRYIVFTTDNEQAAYDYERELISLHGRDNLANLTDGGEGLCNPSAETRERIAKALRGKSPVNKGKPVSEETKRRISATLKGRPLAPHVRETFVKVNIGRKYSRERVEKGLHTKAGDTRYTVISPEGEIHEHIESLRAFERLHSISTNGLRSVVSGRATHANGWVAWIEGQDPKPLPQTFVLIAPDGTRYENILNIAAFAKDHGIDGSQLRNMLRGKRKRTHGWSGWKTSDDPTIKPPIYTLVAPDGAQYSGVTNVSAFAREHNLEVSSVNRIATGAYRQYKGWTCFQESHQLSS